MKGLVKSLQSAPVGDGDLVGQPFRCLHLDLRPVPVSNDEALIFPHPTAPRVVSASARLILYWKLF